MTEQRYKVTAFEVEYHCDQCEEDQCKEGIMRPTGLIHLSNQPMYRHECNMCGSVDFFNTVYPCIRYEREEVTCNPYATINTPMPDLRKVTDNEIKMIDALNRFKHE